MRTIVVTGGAGFTPFFYPVCKKNGVETSLRHKSNSFNFEVTL
jgi:hypothetical protein